MRLNSIEKKALQWFINRHDSSETKLNLRSSIVPFNWNNDTVYERKEDLIRKVGTISKTISTVDTFFTAPDSLKKFFDKSVDKKLKLVRIDYFGLAGLRTITMLISINPKNKKVNGFFFLGDLKYRKVRGITGFP